MRCIHPPETAMLFEIVRHTPVWVWFLLAALLALGISQLRRRRVPPARLLALPIALLAMGLWSTLSNFAAPLLPLLAWGAALAAGALLGRRLPKPAGTAWDGARLLVPGSAIPLVVIVAIFSLRYVGSIALVLHPAWRAASEVALPMSAAFGLIAGVLLGRALGLFALTRRAA
jgi:hypothetical protein